MAPQAGPVSGQRRIDDGVEHD